MTDADDPGPLRDLVAYQDQHWDLSLGKLTEYTQPPSAEVDASWDGISAPPGDSEINCQYS